MCSMCQSIQDLGNTGKDSGPCTPQLHPFGVCYIPVCWGLSARALPYVFLGLAALRSVPMWVMPFVCAVPSMFSLCSSQGFSQRLEGQCCFSPLLCAINITHCILSILRGAFVFTKMAMVQRQLVAGNAGRAAWCPRACSDIPHDELSSNISVFAHPIRKHYQTFKGTQPHNGHFFRHFELLANLSSF